jgi:hypothetical protein
MVLGGENKPFCTDGKMWAVGTWLKEEYPGKMRELLWKDLEVQRTKFICPQITIWYNFKRIKFEIFESRLYYLLQKILANLF